MAREMVTEVETYSGPQGMNCPVGALGTQLFYKGLQAKNWGEFEVGSLSSEEQVGKRPVYLVTFKMALKR